MSIVHWFEISVSVVNGVFSFFAMLYSSFVIAHDVLMQFPRTRTWTTRRVCGKRLHALRAAYVCITRREVLE